jgi:hypothetical protein
MTNIEKLTRAIESQKPITFEYNKIGKTPGLRFGNPHALYIFSPKNPAIPKTTKLDLVQTAGVSDSKIEKPFPDFRQFNITDLSNIEILENETKFEPMLEKFDVEKGTMVKMYNPESERYQNVIAKI